MSFFKKPIAVLLFTTTGLSALPATAETVEEFSDMIAEGEVHLDFRTRFEYVDQDGFDKEAEALTLRSRLSYTSAVYRGFSLMAEVDDVTHIGDDDFNSTANGNTDYPPVPDPEGTDLNQAWIKYQHGEAAGTYGRQRILHGSQRFVGGVGWRQNEQTYDAFRVEVGGIAGLSFDYAYVDTVQRIFGPDDGPVFPADLEGDNHLARVTWAIADGHSINGFAYLLDIDENEDYPPSRSVANSSDTYGLDYAGTFGALSAKAAYALQENAGDSPLDYEAAYYMVELGAAVAGIKGTLGYEVLEGDNGVGFKTPFATLHKFQGWADKFLVTPGDGIEDMYAGVTGEVGPVKLGAFYHDFQANDSSEDFGSEIDMVATWPVNKILTLQVKYANFMTDAEERYADTEKFWLTAQVKL